MSEAATDLAIALPRVHQQDEALAAAIGCSGDAGYSEQVDGWRQRRIAGSLISAGDSRLAVDPRTGLNKYLCPAYPAADLICASSCTASPISAGGFRRAAALFDILS